MEIHTEIRLLTFSRHCTKSNFTSQSVAFRDTEEDLDALLLFVVMTTEDQACFGVSLQQRLRNTDVCSVSGAMFYTFTY